MRQLNDFTCTKCGTTSEHFVASDTNTVRCECGSEAIKAVTKMTPKFNPFSKNATTKSVLQWAKQRDRKLQHERKTSQE